MKTFVGLLVALLLGVAVAFIKPAQPVQMAADNKPAFAAFDVGLDNPNVASDPNIHPARKVRCVGVCLCGMISIVVLIFIVSSIVLFSNHSVRILHGMSRADELSCQRPLGPDSCSSLRVSCRR